MRLILVLTVGLLLTCVLQAEAQSTTTTTTSWNEWPYWTTTTTTYREICSLPIDWGSCTSTQPRWGYNIYSGRCELFYYQGSYGNENNFLTYEDCKARCC
ncbi:kappaPI-actitoxin-Avd3b-like [Microcaecilia unicolor]|uniref:KappaPI-actitoxin-Avd3b-like n=1 Tax=Microcaecilia unicolor TaxID=1415580 RepID=A0A6P7YJ26_9AMPH|nr:kappaPI-actitoxin-Avd3b-like [Microcaecilia unicolor]